MVESHESTNQREEPSLPKNHEDHIAGKRHTSIHETRPDFTILERTFYMEYSLDMRIWKEDIMVAHIEELGTLDTDDMHTPDFHGHDRLGANR